MKTFKWILICIVAGVTGAAGVGCSTIDKVFEDKPPKAVIRISSDPDINPDMNGRPSPIVLRIYALKSDDIFNNADFFALYENDASILGRRSFTARALLSPSLHMIRTLSVFLKTLLICSTKALFFWLS